MGTPESLRAVGDFSWCLGDCDRPQIGRVPANTSHSRIERFSRESEFSRLNTTENNCTTYEIGNILENAVEAIETAILRDINANSNYKLVIETRKKVSIRGSLREIDIYVEMEMAEGYKALYLFECKNRKEKADPSDIDILHTKVRALNAQRGFFIAKSFTNPALNTAKGYGNIEAMLASDNLNIEPLAKIMSSGFNTPNIHAEVELYGKASEEYLNVNSLRTVQEVRLNGETIDYDKYIKGLAQQVLLRIQEHIRNNIDTIPDGENGYKSYVEKIYKEGELTQDDYDVRKLVVHVDVGHIIHRLRVIADINIETKGRVVAFEPTSIGLGQDVSFSIVDLEKDDGPVIYYKVSDKK